MKPARPKRKPKAVSPLPPEVLARAAARVAADYAEFVEAAPQVEPGGDPKAFAAHHAAARAALAHLQAIQAIVEGEAPPDENETPEQALARVRRSLACEGGGP